MKVKNLITPFGTMAIALLLLHFNVVTGQNVTNAKSIVPFLIKDSSQSPVIDGDLSDTAWAGAEFQEDFHEILPNEFTEPSQKTRFKVAYNKDFLFIAVEVLEDDPNQITAQEYILGKAFEADDQLHISIDPFNEDRNGYFFQLNANAISREALITNTAHGFNANWETIWDYEVIRTSEGWVAEIAIPFKSISFGSNNETWGINVGRVIRRESEVLAWSSKGSDVWEMGPVAMGNMGPIRNIRQGKGLDIKLSGIAKWSESDSDFKSKIEPSLDAYYKITPELTLSATINTDFSATEVDDRVLNLTRFDVYFPEKRGFFLQDANQFRFADLNGNGVPFFSRKIGLGNDGTPLSLNAGLKISGGFNQTQIGALFVHQEEAFDGGEEQVLSVVRINQNVLKESTIGMIHTRGNPMSGNDNQLYGADFNYQNSQFLGDRMLRANAWFQNSDEANLDSDGQYAFGATIDYPNAHHALTYDFVQIGERFTPGLGFVNRSNIRENSLRGNITHYYNNYWFHQFSAAFVAQYIDDIDGKELSRFYTFTPLYFESLDSDVLGLSFDYRTERIFDDFTLLNRINVPVDDYAFLRTNFWIHTSKNRPFAFKFDASGGDFFNGTLFDHSYEIDWRPIPKTRINISYSLREIETDTQSFQSRLIRMGLEWAITSKWAWLTNVQYDNVSRLMGINSRLRWRTKSGREFYFVINKGMQRELNGDFVTLEDEIIAKAGYTFRF